MGMELYGIERVGRFRLRDGGKEPLNVFDRKDKSAGHLTAGPKPKAERYNLEAAFI